MTMLFKMLVNYLNQESCNIVKKKVLIHIRTFIVNLLYQKTGLLLRNRRIVLPKSLQEKAIIIAHEGHLGMTKTKSLLRSKVWYPTMDRMVENIISACH